jgi:cytochrome c-type biogenesis protein CcmF
LILWRRSTLRADRPIASVWSREAAVLLATMAIILLATATLLGTLTTPLSALLGSSSISVGPPFYNNVLMPTGLVLLAATAAAPLLRWGNSPTAAQKTLLLLSACLGGTAAALAFASGVRHPMGLAVAGLAAATVATLIGALVVEARRGSTGNPLLRPVWTVAAHRRQYAGFLIHLGLACLAIGITGSSLGTQRHDLEMRKGETVAWAGRSIQYVDLHQHEAADKIVVEARLAVSQDGSPPCTLLPAQHFYRLQNEWAARVAVHSTWSGDFYTVLHGGQAQEGISLTFIENPLMRWLWLSGWIVSVGALLGLCPVRQNSSPRPAVPPPHAAAAAKPHRPATLHV